VKVPFISEERLLAAAASVPPERYVLVVTNTAWRAETHVFMTHLPL
jgi:hypothetical protein